MTKTINKLKPYTRLKPAVLALQIQKGVEDAWVAVDDNGNELARASTLDSVKQAAPEAKDYQPVLDLPGMENQPLTMGDYVIDDGDGIYWTLPKKDFEEQYVAGGDVEDETKEGSSSQSTDGSKPAGATDTSIPKSGENGYVPYDGHDELAIDRAKAHQAADNEPRSAENPTSASTQQSQGQTELVSAPPTETGVTSSGQDHQTDGSKSSENSSETSTEQTSSPSSTSATGQMSVAPNEVGSPNPARTTDLDKSKDEPAPPVVTSTSGQPGDANNPTPAPSSAEPASTTSSGDTSVKAVEDKPHEGTTATGAEPSVDHPVSAESQPAVAIPKDGAPDAKLSTTAQGKTVEITEATRMDGGKEPAITAEVGQPSASDNGQNLEQFAAPGEVLDSPTPDPIHQDKGQDPLDHDGNGRKGGSKAKAKKPVAK